MNVDDDHRGRFSDRPGPPLAGVRDRDRSARLPVVERGLIGRNTELESVGYLLDSVRAGPSVLVLSGDPGIGKSTVWSAGVDLARTRAFATLVCRPTATEVRLSYTGLDDLLSSAPPAVVAGIAPQQARALDAALLRSDTDVVPDPRTVAAALLSVIDTLAGVSPVLVAIDDAQWLDEPTRRALEFAVRRCSGPVAVLATRRIAAGVDPLGGLIPRDATRRRSVELGPLSLGELHHVIRQSVAAGPQRSLPKPYLVRIAELSGGNPFFALELARSVDTASPTVGELPVSLRSLVEGRLQALAAPVCDVLLVVSALADPQIELVDAVAEHTDVLELLERAEDVEVIDLVGGRVCFRHPLFATALYAMATPSARRHVHRKVGALVTDPEQRARHLALAAVAPDTETLAVLDIGARHARARGAPIAAAELHGLAVALGADDPERRVTAAQDYFDAGDPATAQALLETAITELPAGPRRAAALARLGTIRFELEGSVEAVSLLEQAFDEAQRDVHRRCSIALEAGPVLFDCGRGHDALEYLTTAVADAEQLADDGLLAEALANQEIVRFLLGLGVDDANLARALALEDSGRRTPLPNQPLAVVALINWYAARPHEALTLFGQVHQRCIERGCEGELWFVSAYFIAAACTTGDIATATAMRDEVVERALLVGTEQAEAWAQLGRAQVSAWIGRVDEARIAGERAIALAGHGRGTVCRLFALATLGMTELSVGRASLAADRLAPATVAAVSITSEPSATPFLPDAAEALIALGRLDEAEPIIELLEASGRRSDRAWARAVGARCRALMLAAQGRRDDATLVFRAALAAHDAIPLLRFERARTLLVWGQHQRRCRQRRAAATSLLEATRLFDELGAQQWAHAASVEIDCLGLQRDDSDELTPTERRVAEMAAAGMTNRSVATALYISPKTVEAHLSRIYRKLSIHSRAELGRVFASDP